MRQSVFSPQSWCRQPAIVDASSPRAGKFPAASLSIRNLSNLFEKCSGSAAQDKKNEQRMDQRPEHDQNKVNKELISSPKNDLVGER